MYAGKEPDVILRQALTKLQERTPVTSIGPGSVARSLAEVVTTELGDFYSAMDFNTSMGLISSAQGRALDLIGELYAVERRQLGEVATIEQTIGSFYFYLDAPHTQGISIPAGVRVWTDDETFVGDSFTYVTTKEAYIPAGRTRAYTTLRPLYEDSVFTAGANTITQHNVTPPSGVIIRCTNPKPIAPQPGYETDNNYRQRIINHVRTSAGGTTTALRFAGLAVNGVRDIKVRSAPYGLGTSEVLIIPESRTYAGVLVDAVSDEVEAVRPVGVRVLLREPDYVQLGIEATLMLRPNMTTNPDGIADRARNGIVRYLNTLLPGEALVYVRLIQSMLDASEAIADVTVSRLTIDGYEVVRRNYEPEEDEQIIPAGVGNLSIATSV